MMTGYRRYRSRRDIIPIPESVEYIPDLNTQQVIKYMRGPDGSIVDVQVPMTPIESGEIIGPVEEKILYYNNTNATQNITITHTTAATEYITLVRMRQGALGVSLNIDLISISADTNVSIASADGFVFWRTAISTSQIQLRNPANNVVFVVEEGNPSQTSSSYISFLNNGLFFFPFITN